MVGGSRLGVSCRWERDVSDWMTVAKVVTDRLHELGMKQKELAERSRVSVATLRKIQRGVAQTRSDATLRAVSRALELPEDHLRAVADGESVSVSCGTTGPASEVLASLQADVADLRRRVEALEQTEEQPS